MNEAEIHQLIGERKFPEAADRCRQWIASTPVLPMPHALLGWCLFNQGDFAGAASSLHRAKCLDPHLWRVAIPLAQSYIQLQKFNEAYETVEDALREQPNDRTLRALRTQLEPHYHGRKERWELNQRVETRVRMAGEEDD
ncbi:MAG: tetratricopeptide repeat protein [Fimbriimonadaceae bacterium]|nr:tetratricopeptide repeat protein [Fimbriimonadaceae bacterium]